MHSAADGVMQNRRETQQIRSIKLIASGPRRGVESCSYFVYFFNLF